MKPRTRTALAALLLPAFLGGCASAPSPSAYASMPCPELNVAIADTARDMSEAAVTRGTVSGYRLPFWLPGGDAAKQAIADRYTRRIDTGRALQLEMIAERGRRCG